ncbi:hypothetical protein DU504_15655 [Haloplanus salinus]|jgi:hypothetical protein|uniref:RING-type E3 ubiquitin transferase n=1 Tax=Haloplanus salinus TaxID=1126245 RepID=A0A368N4P7_9EURY|nr:GIDE domain-containing protein [Haloplanus salinus]RCU44229.1 hypothetical protein DU504_15655 [Haloplanus salinus]
MIATPVQTGVPATPVVATMVLFVLVGSLSVALGAANLRSYWTVQARERRPPGQIHDGPVAVEGTVREGTETLVAPFSGEECVAYAVRIAQHYTETTSDGSEWRTKFSDRAAVPFVVEDATGAVGVRPSAETLSLSVAMRGVFGPADAPPDRVREFVEQYDASDAPALSVGPIDFASPNHRYRYVERRIGLDERAYAAGSADPDEAVDGVAPTIVATRNDGLFGSNAGSTAVVSDGDAEVAAGTQLKTSLAYIGVGAVLAGIPASLLWGWFG